MIIEQQAQESWQTKLFNDLLIPADDPFCAGDKQSRNNFNSLLEDYRDGQVIPFIGAGLSRDYGIPTWTQFLQDASDEICCRPEIDDFLRVGKYEEAAGCLQDSGLGEFERMFSAAFTRDIRRPEERYTAADLLPFLPQTPVVTTNFDRVLEMVFADAGVSFEAVVPGARADSFMRALRLRSRALLKIHGDALERSDRIITKNEYEKHYGNADVRKVNLLKQLPHLMAHLSRSYCLLFIGCSLDTDRTQELLFCVAQEPGNAHHYALLERPADEAKRRERHKAVSDRFIRPIWYPKGEHEKVRLILRRLIMELEPWSYERRVPRPETPPFVSLLGAVKDDEPEEAANHASRVRRDSKFVLPADEIRAISHFRLGIASLIEDNIEAAERHFAWCSELEHPCGAAEFALSLAQLSLGRRQEALGLLAACKGAALATWHSDWRALCDKYPGDGSRFDQIGAFIRACQRYHAMVMSLMAYVERDCASALAWSDRFLSQRPDPQIANFVRVLRIGAHINALEHDKAVGEANAFLSGQPDDLPAFLRPAIMVPAIRKYVELSQSGSRVVSAMTMLATTAAGLLLDRLRDIKVHEALARLVLQYIAASLRMATLRVGAVARPPGVVESPRLAPPAPARR